MFSEWICVLILKIVFTSLYSKCFPYGYVFYNRMRLVWVERNTIYIYIYIYEYIRESIEYSEQWNYPYVWEGKDSGKENIQGICALRTRDVWEALVNTTVYSLQAAPSRTVVFLVYLLWIFIKLRFSRHLLSFEIWLF